jgi:lipopolysaccharide transport system ATP-binding protein
MSKIMIRGENVSKYYKLGTLGSGRFREDFRHWWQRTFSKKQTGDFSDKDINEKGVWALQDVSFEISQGEVLGVIGNNGAGKSTLLKIISRITAPSGGCIMGNGRVASLLEIGTGFHGELTGRENILLNGHILGMKKKEIASRFDEIVDFSGVGKFIDTPVKRYSSGMYTRLAFAVAAHMDPEILIVDEVLAVGDAEFQRKSIGKMKKISSQEGKTVLFVSHNMQALQNLCHRVITLHEGRIVDSGNPEAVIGNYLKAQKSNDTCQEFESMDTAPGNEAIRIKKVELIAEYLPGQQVIDIRTAVAIHFHFWHLDKSHGSLIAGIHLFNMAGECIFDISSPNVTVENGLIEGSCRIPGNFLNDGSYYISIVFVKDTTRRLFYFESCLSFDVEDYRPNTAWYGKWIGYVRPDFPVNLISKNSGL